MASAASVQTTISKSLEPLGIKRSAATRAFAANYVNKATTQMYHGSSSLSNIGAIDSTMEALGPIMLDHADTLGEGRTNVNVLGNTSRPSFTARNPGLPLLRDATRELAAQLGYRLDLRAGATALAISHGLTDNLDISLLLTLVHIDLTISGSLQLDRVKQGNKFVKLPPAPTLRTAQEIAATGLGDITLRLKYRLPVLGPFHSVLALESQMPTGDKAKLLGSGEWWVTPTLTVNTLLGSKADITAKVGVDFPVSNPIKTQLLYGIGVSGMLLPGRLVGVVELLGRSELDSQPSPQASNTLYLTPSGVIGSPIFGLSTGRSTYLDLSFGLRFKIYGNVVGFLNGIYALNSLDLHEHQIIPVAGLGANF